MWVDTSSSSLAVKSPQLWHGPATGGRGLPANHTGDKSPKWNQPDYFLKQNLASFVNLKASTMDPKLWHLIQELQPAPPRPSLTPGPSYDVALLSHLGVGHLAHATPVPACEEDSSAITSTYHLSELQDAGYPNHRGKLLLMGIKRGKKGWGRGLHFP